MSAAFVFRFTDGILSLRGPASQGERDTVLDDDHDDHNDHNDHNDASEACLFARTPLPLFGVGGGLTRRPAPQRRPSVDDCLLEWGFRGQPRAAIPIQQHRQIRIAGRRCTIEEGPADSPRVPEAARLESTHGPAMPERRILFSILHRPKAMGIAVPHRLGSYFRTDMFHFMSNLPAAFRSGPRMEGWGHPGGSWAVG
jgi:hypothetical protein